MPTPVQNVVAAHDATVNLLREYLGGDGDQHPDMRPGERVGLLIVPHGTKAPELHVMALLGDGGETELRSLAAIVLG